MKISSRFCFVEKCLYRCEIAGFDNCRIEGYSDMLGTRFFNTLCKKVIPSNLSNKKNRKIGVSRF